MLPFATLIPIQKDAAPSIYLQISNEIINRVKSGVIKTGTKLPGSRQLAVMLGVHRKTVIAAYDELFAQGWIEIIPSKGTFISGKIPEVKPVGLNGNAVIKAGMAGSTGFEVVPNPHLNRRVYTKTRLLEINDGFPDHRLAPLQELGVAYRNVMKKRYATACFSYDDIEGNKALRVELSNYFNETRGFQTTYENVFITRGSMMGLYLSVNTIVKPGDQVIVGNLNYKAANTLIQNAGGILVTVPVDEGGLSVEAVEEICRKKKIRAMYITPHHHYPTTVTLTAERRMALLSLAEKYGFAILEDDYDYEFHYKSSPILPLASADRNGMVVYLGSLSKTFSPAFRIGYIVAPVNFIEAIAVLRRYVDRQGDPILEFVMALLFKEGVLKSHLKKSQKVYHQRRDLFCGLLENALGDRLRFRVPDGGLAVWGEFDKGVDLVEVSQKAQKKGLYISDGQFYNPEGINLNATRMGFASLDFEEIERAVGILGEVVTGL